MPVLSYPNSYLIPYWGSGVSDSRGSGLNHGAKQAKHRFVTNDNVRVTHIVHTGQPTIA